MCHDPFCAAVPPGFHQGTRCRAGEKGTTQPGPCLEEAVTLAYEAANFARLGLLACEQGSLAGLDDDQQLYLVEALRVALETIFERVERIPAILDCYVLATYQTTHTGERL